MGVLCVNSDRQLQIDAQKSTHPSDRSNEARKYTYSLAGFVFFPTFWLLWKVSYV